MKKILIVDDKPQNLYLLRVLLTGHGFEVDEARHGAEALVKARQSPPQLIISDLLMPVMDGYTLLHQWKADERLKRIPFVVYTATYTEPQDEELARDLGADGFIIKPAEPEVFLRQIQEIIVRLARLPVAKPVPAGAFARLPISVPEEDEASYLLQYNAVLVGKLEKKLEQLEKSKRELEQDIAGRKQVEERLQKMRFCVDHASDAMFWISPEGRLLYVNAAACRQRGYTESELLGMTVFDLDPDFLPGGWGAHWEELKRHGTMIFETRHRTKDGRVFPVEVNANYVRHGTEELNFAFTRDITERKQAEEILAAEQHLSNSLIATSPDRIYFKDRESRFIKVNGTLARMHEFADGRTLLGKTDFEIFGDEHARQAYADEQRIMATGEPMIDQEEREDWPDGRVTWVISTKLPLLDTGGKIIGLMGISRDITERKRMEMALLTSQSRLEEAQRIAHVGSWEWDAATDTPVWSKELCAILEVDPTQPSPSVAEQHKLYTPESMKKMHAAIEQTMRTGEPYEIELQRVWADGTNKWLLARGEPVFNEQRQVTGLRGTALDITGRKQAEEEIARERNLLRAIFDILPDHIYLKDEQSRFVMFNEPCTADNALPTTAEELAGKTDADFYPPEQAAQFRADELVVLGGTPIIDKEETFVRPDGSQQVILTTKLPFRDGTGKITGLLGYGRDITDRKRAEETVANERHLLRTLIDRLPETFYIKDLDSRFLVVNEPLAKHLGKDAPSQILGLSDADIYPAGLAAEFRAEELKVFAGEPLINQEITMVSPDGQERTVLTTKLPYRDNQGKIIGLVGIGHDITERKQAEDEIARERNLLRTMFDIFPGYVYLKDEQSRFVMCNNRRDNDNVTPVTADNLIGKTDADFLPPEQAAQFRADDLAVLGGTPLIDKEETLFRPDGSRQVILTTKLPLRDGSGKITGLVGFGLDITTRKQAEEALKLSDERLQQAIRAGSLGIFDHDHNADTIYWSPKMKQIYGWDLEEPVTLPKYLQQVHEEDRAQIAEAVQCAHDPAGKGLFDVEHRIINRNGDIRWLNTRSITHFEGEGKARHKVRTVGAVVDITERKLAGEALRQSEEQFRLIMENLADLVAVLDLDGRRLYNSPSYQAILGDPNQLRGTSSFDQIHPEDRDRVRAAFHETVRTGAGQRLEYRMLGRDGEARHIESQGSVIRDEQGKVFQVVVVSRDITERKQAELHIQQLNRVYSVLSDINQTIVREKDPQAMLEAVCRIAVEKGRFRMAWIGKFDPATQELKPVASSGTVEGYLEVVKIKMRDKTQATGPSVRCLRSGKHAICNDIAHEPDFLPWRDEALRRGYRSSSGFPLKIADQVVGVFSLYADNPGFFDTDELNLLDELAMDISFALEVSQREQERLKAETELRWRTAFFEAQVDSALDGILVVDNQGQKILQNSQMIQMLKLPTHVAGNPDNAAQLDHLAGKMKHHKQYMAKIAHLYSHPDEVSRDEIEMVDGTILDRSTAPVRDKTGYHYGRIWTFRDITERKRVEESHTRLATAVEQSGETIMITDLEGTIVYVNPAFEKTTGYTRAEALGQNPRFFKSGKHDAEFYRRIWEVLGHGEIWSGHFINKRKDGTFFEEEATITPVRDAAGEVVNYVVVKRDVTREMQLEAQFRQSQKMEAIGQLAGGVAHDFNNVLAVIMMQAELTAMEENLPEQVGEGLKQIRAAAERAANLTRQLLLFSRKQVMQRRDLDLNECVTSLAKMLQRILGEDVRLQLHLHSRPLMTRADAGMLDQVLLNLVVNARDAMPGGGRLTIETRVKNFTEAEAAVIPDAKPGRHVCLRVTDTGSGIAPEIMTRIFEPFFTTKEPGKGTGLGLATVFGIVKQHGGSLTVESEVGKGTTFQIVLPASKEAVESPEEATVMPEPRGGTETILLVEDEPSVRLLTRSVLERAGYQVLEAAHGVEALKIWGQQQDKIQLLFTDIVMPEGISGRELATRLRTQNPRLRIIFTSGYSADIAGQDLALQEGQNFVQKPSSPRHLLETVRKCLDG
jgi:two-component system cell cycle sensor histidine kinase/response regulator CckA